MQGRSKFFAFVMIVLVGCGGGGGETKAKPLKTRYDEALLVQVAADQRNAADAARATWLKSQDENRKAEADFKEVDGQMSIVKNGKKQAELELSNARAMKKQAGADANKQNQAENQERAAEMGKKAAEARIKYYEAYRSFLKKWIRFTAEQMYWREAQYELAKSQVGQAAGLRRSDINYAEFGPQEAERAKRAEKARDAALSDKQHAASAREEWLKTQSSADQQSGKRSNFPDPMLAHSQAAGSTGT
jgi:hypothetical protein